MRAEERFMRVALEHAELASRSGEVPIGAVVVLDGTIIAAGHNQPISETDPTAHAEIVALRAAALRVSNYRLPGSSIYVTVEPCLMCLGAMVHVRIDRLIYGARASSAGGREVQRLDWESLNHRFEIVAGILETECSDLLTTFFRSKRGRDRAGCEDGFE